MINRLDEEELLLSNLDAACISSYGKNLLLSKLDKAFYAMEEMAVDHRFTYHQTGLFFTAIKNIVQTFNLIEKIPVNKEA